MKEHVDYIPELDEIRREFDKKRIQSKSEVERLTNGSQYEGYAPGTAPPAGVLEKAKQFVDSPDGEGEDDAYERYRPTPPPNNRLMRTPAVIPKKSRADLPIPGNIILVYLSGKGQIEYNQEGFPVKSPFYLMNVEDYETEEQMKQIAADFFDLAKRYNSTTVEGDNSQFLVYVGKMLKAVTREVVLDFE